MSVRLAEFRIEGLFGLYDHRIRVNQDERITIIIGPNGRGKTVCLKFIEALFRGRHGYFSDIPFRSAEFIFANGQSVRLDRVAEEQKGAVGGPPANSVRFTLNSPGKRPISWSPGINDERLRREFRRYIPSQWEQVSPDLWVDETDGEELTFVELARRVRLPPKLMEVVQRSIPDEFREIVK